MMLLTLADSLTQLKALFSSLSCHDLHHRRPHLAQMKETVPYTIYRGIQYTTVHMAHHAATACHILVTPRTQAH